MLAVVSLLFRNWLYVFWKDFNNSKELQSKFLELELEAFETNENNALDHLDGHKRNRAMSINKRRKNYLHKTRETHFKKWLKKLCTYECIFEIIVLCIHPFPYLEEEYTFKIINMLGSKDSLVDVKYLLSDFLFAFMFLRFYFLLRTITNFSIYSELNSQRICQNNGFYSNTSFCLKANI